MEWITKILSVLKIPLKILLPAICLFSGSLIFLNDTVLIKLYLLEWRNQNGFALGLTFTISMSLIIVYMIYYFKSKFQDILFRLTINKKTIRTISQLSDKQKSIIMEMYFSNGYTMDIDYADPVVKSLIAEKIIYLGSNAQIISDLNDHLWTKGTLQKFVWRALQWEYEKNNKDIYKLKKKIDRTKDPIKKKRLENELSKCFNIEKSLRRS